MEFLTNRIYSGELDGSFILSLTLFETSCSVLNFVSLSMQTFLYHPISYGLTDTILHAN